jgi:hypothetical protein
MKNVNQVKLLVLLVGIVLFINYRNYLMPDRDRLAGEAELLKAKIERERTLNSSSVGATDRQLKVPWQELFYDGKKLNYSQAMGQLQKRIQAAAKGVCKVVSLTWAQVPGKAAEYDRLKMNLALECSPPDFFTFVNRLRGGGKGKLILLRNLRIAPLAREKSLRVNTQIIAFRIHDAR